MRQAVFVTEVQEKESYPGVHMCKVSQDIDRDGTHSALIFGLSPGQAGVFVIEPIHNRFFICWRVVDE